MTIVLSFSMEAAVVNHSSIVSRWPLIFFPSFFLNVLPFSASSFLSFCFISFLYFYFYFVFFFAPKRLYGQRISVKRSHCRNGVFSSFCCYLFFPFCDARLDSSSAPTCRRKSFFFLKSNKILFRYWMNRNEFPSLVFLVSYRFYWVLLGFTGFYWVFFIFLTIRQFNISGKSEQKRTQNERTNKGKGRNKK